MKILNNILQINEILILLLFLSFYQLKIITTKKHKYNLQKVIVIILVLQKMFEHNLDIDLIYVLSH